MAPPDPDPERDDRANRNSQQACEDCAQNKAAAAGKDAPDRKQPPRKDKDEGGAAAAAATAAAAPDGTAQLVVPPDGGWGWVVAFASFMCNVMVDGIIFSFGTLKPHIGAEFGVSNAKVALVGSLLSGCYLLVGPFVSALANRYGFRLVAMLGSALSVAAFCVSYVADSIEFLYVSYGLAGGVGFGLIYVPAVIAVGFYFERWRALATGIAVCGSGIGAFVLAPIFSTMAASVGWRSALFLQAALAGSCALFGTLFRPLSPTKLALAEVERLDAGADAAAPLPAEDVPAAGAVDGTPGARRRAAYPTAAEAWTRSTASLHKSAHSLHDHHHHHHGGGGGSRRHSLRPAAQPRTRADTLTGGDAARPLYRDDIFFGGSLARLPQYQSRSSLAYTMSVTRLATEAELAEEREGAPCRVCPEAVRRALATLLDVSLLASPSFVLLALSGGLTMMGFYVPFMYLQERADATGMAADLSMWLVASVGVCNTAGRLLCGLLSSSVRGVDTLLVNNVALCVGGVATLLSGLSASDAYQFTYCCVFGLSIACFASLRSVIMVELVGLENLTNAFGLSLLFQGVAAAVGAPMAGALLDASGTYDATFYLSGALILFSGAMCFPLRALSRWELARRKAAACSGPSVPV